MKMKMNNDELVRVLEDLLAPNYAFNFRVIAETDEMVLLQAVAGNAEGLDNQVLDYKVSKLSDFVEDGDAFYFVGYRPMTGWSDEPHAEWRWSTHVQEKI